MNANLKCNTSKVSLFTKTIDYLSRVVINASIVPEQTKLDRIEQWQLLPTCGELVFTLALATTIES